MKRNDSNQDISFCAENGCSCTIALADGVSSCSHAMEGAMSACLSVGNYYAKYGNGLIMQSRDLIAQKTVSGIVCDLNNMSRARGVAVEEFSSTIAAVYYDKQYNSLLCINIGDGIVCGVGKRGFEIFMQPQDSTGGCYVTTTKGIETKMDIRIIPAENLNSVFICSDGMWRDLFVRNKLREEFKDLILQNNYHELLDIVDSSEADDDRSIVVMTIPDDRKKEAA